MEDIVPSRKKSIIFKEILNLALYVKMGLNSQSMVRRYEEINSLKESKGAIFVYRLQPHPPQNSIKSEFEIRLRAH